MRRIWLKQYITPSFRTLGMISFLSLGLSTLHAASLPEAESIVSGERASEEPAIQGNDWSRWMIEGNSKTFLYELEKITQCVEDEGVDVKNLPAKVSDMSACQQQVRSAANYRDSAGHNLLQTYLKNSEPDKMGDAIVKEGLNVINALVNIGMILVDWEREQPEFDNLFFLAIKYDKLGLLNQLFAGIKMFDSAKISKLSEMRSSQGVNLADAILTKKPDDMSAIAMIMNYKLISDISQVTHTKGMAYSGLSIMLKGKTEL